MLNDEESYKKCNRDYLNNKNYPRKTHQRIQDYFCLNPEGISGSGRIKSISGEYILYSQGSPCAILDLFIERTMGTHYIVFMVTNEDSIISCEIKNARTILDLNKANRQVEVNLVYLANPDSITNECNNLEIIVERLSGSLYYFMDENPLDTLGRVKKDQRRIEIPILPVISSEGARLL